jgi:hypothetical protein
MRLKTLRRSHRPEKKWDAVFVKDNGKEKVVPFGQKGYNDFLIYNKTEGEKTAKVHRQRYLKRHSGMGEKWSQPDTAGALSRWILWGDSTSLRKNLKTFKQKFNV